MSRPTMRQQDSLHSIQLIDWDPNAQSEALIARLEAMPGIRRVELNLEQNRLMVLGRVELGTVIAAVESFGIGVDHGEEELRVEKTITKHKLKWVEWIQAIEIPAIERKYWIVAGIIIAVSFVTGIMLSLPEPSPLLIGLLWAVGGFVVNWTFVGNRAIQPLAGFGGSGTSTNVIACVILIATIVKGAWLEGLVVSLVLIGMEFVTRRMVRRIVDRMGAPLHELPTTILYISDAGDVIVRSIDDIRVGDTLRIGTGQIVPVDGRVIAGGATLDGAALTGETIPYARGEGQRIFAGTLVVEGEIDMIAEREPGESFIHLCRDEHRLHEARAMALKGFFGNGAKRYTAVIVYLALGILVIPPLVFGEAVNAWLWRGLMLLAVAPANGLLTAAVLPLMAARVRVAELGVLIGSPKTLRKLSRSSLLVLTQSVLIDTRQTLLEVVPCVDIAPEQALQLAASLSRDSVHPTAQAIVKAAEAQEINLSIPWNFEELPARGIEAKMTPGAPGADLRLGTTTWMQELSMDLPASFSEWIEGAAQESARIVWLADESKVLAALIIGERLTDGTNRFIERLRRLGIKRMALVTSAERERAERVADQAGIDEVYAPLSLAEQTKLINGWQDLGERVVTVGCTVDDRPSLNEAFINIWLGEEQLPLPQEQEVVAVGHTTTVLTLISLAKRFRRVAVRSTVLAWVSQVLFVYLAITGQTTLWVLATVQGAVFAVLVLLGIRLLKHRR